jgi:hypothetical protein
MLKIDKRFIVKRDATGKQIFRGNVKETSTVCCC